MVSTAANCAKVQTQVRVSQVTAGTIGGQYFKVDFHMPEDTGDGGNSTVEIEDYWIEMSNESAFPAGAALALSRFRLRARTCPITLRALSQAR